MILGRHFLRMAAKEPKERRMEEGRNRGGSGDTEGTAELQWSQGTRGRVIVARRPCHSIGERSDQWQVETRRRNNPGDKLLCWHRLKRLNIERPIANFDRSLEASGSDSLLS